MADEITAAPTTGIASRHLSRRSVLRTAAHAAWVVPAVQFASAAPAFAASVVPPTTISVAAQITWNGTATSSTFKLDVTVTNAGHSPTGVDLVTLQFPTGWNPTFSPTTGWAGSGTTTITYTPSGIVLAPTASPGNATTFSITLNPVDSKVGAGSYSADGAGSGLTITTTASNAPSVNTLVDLKGLYANLVVAPDTGNWSRSGAGTGADPYVYYVTFITTVTNRGRTGTVDLEVIPTDNWSAANFTAADNVDSGWQFQTPGTDRFNKSTPQLAAGAEVSLSARMRYAGTFSGGSATAGTITLTPRDNGRGTTEVARAGAITVAAKSTWP